MDADNLLPRRYETYEDWCARTGRMTYKRSSIYDNIKPYTPFGDANTQLVTEAKEHTIGPIEILDYTTFITIKQNY